MATITAHCIVKNEENFVGYAIRSVVDFVDQVLVFDTGSTDRTAEIISGLAKEYPDKVIFEEKGLADKKRHSQLRQEMIDRTTTDWFMILDGDEVWTERGMQEAQDVIKKYEGVRCLIAPFYLCVGDLFHAYPDKGTFEMLGRKGFFSPRVIRKDGIRWKGDYNVDVLVDESDQPVFSDANKTVFLQNRYWHMTHLRRSSKDDGDYSSGGSRKEKRRETYFLIGRRIKESLPEVFDDAMLRNSKISFPHSLINFLILSFRKML